MKNRFTGQQSSKNKKKPWDAKPSKFKKDFKSDFQNPKSPKKEFSFERFKERQGFKNQTSNEFPFDSILERRLGVERLKSLADQTAQQVKNLVSSNNNTKSHSRVTETPLPSVTPTRGFALAQFRAEKQLQEKESADPKRDFKTPGGLLLDPWQQEAVQALLDGKHIIVDAPTSAGKTRVIEALLEYRAKEGGKLVYTSPVKSLSNDKYREFSEKYGREKVGINTGDFKENLGAPLILATLETYRNSLLGIEPDMTRKVVVYDEYHFLQDESRGSAWEESLILTPKQCQLVLLSASVPNCEEFADWIQDLTGRNVHVIRVTKRPVPLEHMVFTKHGWIFCHLIDFKNEEISQIESIAKQLRRDKSRFRGRDAYKEYLLPLSQALEMGVGPIVVYAGRRGDVEGIASSFAKFFRNEFSDDIQVKLRNRVKNLSGWEYVSGDLQRLILKYGIAYHHSGMIPPARVAIESLLKEGLLRLCCGTMGISLGVNFAVRSAFISDESRPSEGGQTYYSNTEIMQMLGRAGRRGHDKQGFSLWLHPGRYIMQRPREREACRSSLKFDPTTVIGILGQHQSIDYLNEFYKKSFDVRRKDHKQIKQNNKSLNRIVSHLQHLGALDGAQPTEMGSYARHFPQAGGLIISHWLSTGQINKETFVDYLQVMACFGAAHFKEIPNTFSDQEFLNDLKMHELIDEFYPYSLFPELYDEVKVRKFGADEGMEPIFREFNLGAASLVKCWLNPKTTWDELVSEHSSKYFSDGDCMNVLFRFATFLQSCARLTDTQPAIAAESRRLWKILLREPLDARNRLLIEEDDEFENVPKSDQDDQGVDGAK